MKGAIVGLGIFVLVIAAILCLYPVKYTYSILGTPISTWVEYPYREYGFIFFVVGVLVLVVGFAIPERPSPAPSREKARFCSQCGKPVSTEAKFCPNCGKEVRKKEG